MKEDDYMQELCNRIVRMFIYSTSRSEEVIDRFYAWLLDPQHSREKDIALRSVFNEIIDGKNDCDGYVTECYKEFHVN